MNERSTATRTALEPAQVKIVEAQTLLERLSKLSEQISRRAYEIFEGKGRGSVNTSKIGLRQNRRCFIRPISE